MAKGIVKLGTGAVLAGLALGLVLLWGPGGCGDGGPTGSLPPGVSGLYFSADDGTDGREPWVLRSPSLSPVQLKDINGAGGSSDPQSFVRLNDTVYFTARDGAGRELWQTDGTSAGTEQVIDLHPGGDGIPDGAELTVFDGRLYFAATAGDKGVEPWVSDGTAGGTQRLKDINPNGSSDPARFTESGGQLFFTAANGTDGKELYVTDGTEPGTELLEINPDGPANPRYLTDLNGLLLFQATNGSSGLELFESQGGDSSTGLVENITNGSDGSRPAHLTAFNGYIYFSADGPQTDGPELYRSDVAQANLVEEINNDVAAGSNPANFQVAGFRLFFAANEAARGRELYAVSSATPKTAAAVEDIYQGSGSSSPTNLADFGGTLVFQANDGETGPEPWQSDGTGEGTRRLADLDQGGNGSNPADFTVFEDQLFFAADDGEVGRELWRITSLSLQPILVEDLFSGDSGSDPRELAAL